MDTLIYVPHSWDFCKLIKNTDLCVLINNTSYLIVYFAFVFGMLQLVLGRVQKQFPGIRLTWAYTCFVAAIVLLTVHITIWPVLLQINYFFTCSFYHWTTIAVVSYIYYYLYSPGVYYIFASVLKEIHETHPSTADHLPEGKATNAPINQWSMNTHSEGRQHEWNYAGTADQVPMKSEDRRQVLGPSVERQRGSVPYVRGSRSPLQVTQPSQRYNGAAIGNVWNTSGMRNNGEEGHSVARGIGRDFNNERRLDSTMIPTTRKSSEVMTSSSIPRYENSSEYIVASASIPIGENSRNMEGKTFSASNISTERPSSHNSSETIQRPSVQAIPWRNVIDPLAVNEESQSQSEEELRRTGSVSMPTVEDSFQEQERASGRSDSRSTCPSCKRLLALSGDSEESSTVKSTSQSEEFHQKSSVGEPNVKTEVESANDSSVHPEERASVKSITSSTIKGRPASMTPVSQRVKVIPVRGAKSAHI